ncbi:radical SAM protein [Flavobacteriales bacterium]|nr:radical SAM protein [Flavobacteriales bacterium]
MASTYDRYSEAVNGAPNPRVLTLELSNTCNLACEMCWGHYSSKIRSVRDRLPAVPSPYDEAFLDQIVPLLPTVQEVRFVGGEPLLVPLYRKMLKAIAHHNPLIEVRITTNGTVVDHELEELMWGMNMSIHFSIDSFTPETYEGIRKGGTFSTVMSNFRRFVSLRDEGKIHMIGVSICPMRSNIHEIPSMLSLLNEMGIPAYFNNTTYPTFLSLRTLHPTLLNPIVRELEELQPIHDGDLGNQLQLEGLVTQLKGWSYLNGKLVSYGAQDLRDTLENRSDNVNKEVQRISLILIEIHIHTVFQVDDSEGFKAVRSKLDQLARNADEQISVELIDAIKLVAEVIGNITGRNLHGQAVSFNRFLKDTPNAYRVLLSFIVRNDIIFMLHTLDDETIENMASFAVYDEKR